MPRHVECWVDGTALSSVGPFWIQQVFEDPAAAEVTEGERPGRAGTLAIGKKRQSLKVAIELTIHELHDLAARTHWIEQLAAWAGLSGTHVLQLSSHPGRRLTVRCTAEPALGEARNYASAVRIEWTAYEVPYWEDQLETVLDVSGDDETGTLVIPGTAPAPVSLTVTAGAAVTEMTVSAGDSEIELTGLELETGDILTFTRDARDNLMIKSGNTVLLSCRTAESADDLLAGPGPVPVSFTADGECDVRFSVRGRWS